MASQYPPPPGRTGFQPIDPAFQRPGDDHVVNIPLTPIETHRSARTKEDASTYNRGSLEKVRPPFERAENTLDALGSDQKRGGRRRLIKNGPNAYSDGEETALNKVGLFYEKVLNFSFVTRWLIYIAPLALILAIPIIVGSTAAPEAELGGVRIVWIFAWTEIVWCSLWIAKLVAKGLPIVFRTLVGVVSSGTRKYYKVIQKLELPIALVAWTFASWLSFVPMMTRNPDKRAEKAGTNGQPPNPNAFDTQAWQTRLNQILAAFLVACLANLIKCIVVQLISVQYHSKQFSARISTNKEYIKMLTALLECSRNMFPAYCPEFAEEDYVLSIGLVNGLVTPSGKASGIATPMRFLQQIGRVGDNVTSAVGRVAKEITGRNVLNPNSPRSIVVDALTRKTTIEALARRIWMSFVEEGKDSLYSDDFVEVMGLDRKDEAKTAFTMLDKDENGDISLDEMIASVTDVARERKTLAKSMGDIDSAIGALDSLLSTILFVIIVFIFIAFLNQNFITTLATTGTALLSISFVFAATAQEILGSCVFIFVKHPYDVGDRIDIETKEYVVEHISLLYTIFRHLENNKFVQIPNNILNGKNVENVSRSQPMREIVKFEVNFDTSMRDIQLLRSELLRFVEENSRDFRCDNVMVDINTVKLESLELKCEIKYKGNWADNPKRMERRNKFLGALVAALRKVPIYGAGAGDPGLGEAGNAQYFVTIDPREAQRRKEEAARDKEAKRYKTSEEIEAEQAAEDANRPPAILTTSPSQTALVGNANAGNVASDPRDETLLSDGASIISRANSTRRAELDQVRDIMRQASQTGRRRRGGSISGAQNEAQSPVTASSSGFQPVGHTSSFGQNLGPQMRRPSATPNQAPQIPPQTYGVFPQPGASYQSQQQQSPPQQQPPQQGGGYPPQHPSGQPPRDPRDPSARY